MIVKMRALGEFVDVFDAPEFRFGAWHAMEVIDGVVSLPMFSTSAETSRFIQTCYDVKCVPSDVNWTEWKSSEEAARLRDEPGAVEGATPRQLCRLLTVMIRQERFVEGSLNGHFESGFLMRVLRRAKALAEELQKEGD